jgi:CheY-like chemotaxis protein
MEMTRAEHPTEPPGILVVEDDPALARTLRQLLTASGYRVWGCRIRTGWS